MKKTSLIKIIAMILALCMFLTSCGVLEKVFGKDKEPIVDPEDPGVTDNDPDVCHHTKTELKDAKTASCTVEGYTGDKVCTSCSAVVEKGEKIPVTAHKTKIRNAKAATCVTEGYTGDAICTSCGTIVEKGSSIAITNHSYDSGMTTKVPTCMYTGTKTFTCGGCGITYSEELPVVGHDDMYHDMLDGTHNHTCASCTLTENEAHVPTDEGTYVPASCEESAYTKYTCSICNGVYKVYDESSEPTGHAYGEWEVVDATCVADGYKVHDCTLCEKSETIVIEKTPNVHNHEFSHYESTAPTCSEGAVEVYVCTDCEEDSYTKDVPATGAHSFGEPVDSGDGWVRKSCTVCEYEVSSFDASKLKDEGVNPNTIPTDVPLNVTNDTAAMEFPTDVIDQFKSGENVKIDAGVLTGDEKSTAIAGATNLSAEEKARLEDVELYDFNVTIDGTALSGNFATAVTVTVPYELKTLVDDDGNEYLEDKDGIVIWYVSEDGTITKFTDVQYNEETKTVTFLAPHFSMYAVAYEETQEMKCRRGYHDFAVISTVDPTCSGFGFSTLKCTCCHRITVDNIIEKLHHTYGELIPAQPTCDSGDYDHKICTECGDVLLIKYYRELGHQLDAAATCTTGSYCSRCEKIAVAPLGHVWSEWRVVVHAGPLTNGLRVRYCLRCGEAQESETASTGDITALKFESYEELLDAVYDLVISVDKARIEFTLDTLDFGVVGVTALVDKSGEDMLVLVNFTVDGEEAGMAYYKNGVVLIENMGEYGTVSLDSAVAVSIDIAAAYMQAYYNLINPYFEMGVTSVREQLSTYIDIAGEQINQILAAAGIPYTGEDLLALLDSIETTYAYVSLKLGYVTALEMKDGVPVPTKADFVNILTAFMESTTDGRNTTYTTNTEELLGKINAVLESVMELCDTTIEGAIFEKLGDRIAELDPTIVDMGTLVAYMKAKLPGTLKVNEALDVVESIMLELGDMTIDELYALINEIMSATYGEEFDIEAMLAEYYSLTLNDLFCEMVGDDITAEQFYDAIAEQFKEMTVGDIYVGEGTLAEYVEYVSYRLNTLPIDADFSFTVDAYGKLISLDLDESMTAEVSGENGTEEVLIHSAIVKIVRDNSIVVTMPEEFAPVDVRVEGSIDEDGNYVITGVPEGADIDISFNGGYNANLDDVLIRDPETSEKLGFDVYITPEGLWTHQEYTASLIKIGDKYYTFGMEETRGEYPDLDKYVCQMDLFEFLENPASVLPEEGDEPLEYYEGTPIYASPIGYLMQVEGEWWVCEARLELVYDKTEYGPENERYALTEVYPSYNFNEKFVNSTVELSSIEDYYYDHYYWYDSVNFNVRIDLYLGDTTYEFKGTSDYDGVRLAYIPDGHIEEKHNRIYLIGSEVSLKAYEYDNLQEYQENAIIQIKGERSEGLVNIVYLYKYAPDYYLKVADGAYLHLDTKMSGILGDIIIEHMPASGYIRTDVDVSGLETKQLSDGNTMYVVGTADAYVGGYTDGVITYGFVQIGGNAFVRAYCLEQGEYMVDVVYEACRSEMHVYYDALYNVADYVTVENGVITLSSALVSKLLESCKDPGENILLTLTATKRIGKEVYHYLLRDFLKFNIEDDISLPGTARPDSPDEHIDVFYALFEGYNQGDKYELITYVDENGDLVLEGAEILDIFANFENRFPADPFLEYDAGMSNETGLDIYSYKYDTYSGASYIYQGGKYYHYSWQPNYAVETQTLGEMLSKWRVEDMRYCYTIYPDEGTPAELHNKMVYNIYVTCLDSATYRDEGIVNEVQARITLYGFVMDGELQILTGAVPSGESLVTFEGYKPFDQYMSSLEYSINSEEYNEVREYVIEGTPTNLTYRTVVLTEPDYDVSYYVHLYEMGSGNYISRSSYINEYVMIHDEAMIPDDYILEREYQGTFCNGIYTLVDFEWIEEHKYYAIKIGDIFYDYDDYYNNWYNQISDLEEFRQQMCDTDRVYRVWDHEIGGYRYYNSFIPGEYFEGTDELYGFGLPTDQYNESYLGRTKEGYDFYEIVYYVDESIDPEILELTLKDGRKFYHIDGIGYVKLREGHYVKAVLAYDDEGRPYAMCLYRKAHIYDFVLTDHDVLDEYFSRTDRSIIIPHEMLEYMSGMPDYCCFYVSTSFGEIRFNYYILEAYFRGEMNGGYGGDYGDKDYGDKDYGKG